ncbi:cation diffusion facilitator family transporter [Flavobacterium sp. ZB4P13]|uniref:cation diffusion facilitator family transporter n=1 Tax=Flavobacterium sp. ZB4P13 TaxID=3401728 RepID=UPI003AAC1CF6
MKQISSGKAVWTSFLVDFGDIVLNVVVMIVTGSVVMLAEAFEGLSDLVASGLLLIGLGIARRRPNKKHPFGYGKALFFWTLISAIVILVFGASLSIFFGVQRLLYPEEVEKIVWAFAALCISIITNGYALSLSSRRLLGKEKFTKLFRIFLSTTHVESKNTFILDFAGTFSAIVGLLSLSLYQLVGIQYFDAIGAILIGILAAASSLLLIWGVKDYLIGKTASEDIEQSIKQAALKITEVDSIISLDTMYLGSEKLLVHLDIHLRHSVNNDSGEIVEKIKQSVQKAVPIVYSIQIETQAR